MSAADPRPLILLVGPVPPPAHGVARATQLMLDSSTLAERIRLVHLDTTDSRGVANMGKLDLGNVYLGVRHVLTLAGMILRHRPDAVLLTASQGRLALIRDGLFALLARVFRRRVVTYLRGSGYAQVQANQGRVAGSALRYILKASARVIVLGEGLVNMAHAIWPEASVSVVPNGCPPAVSAHQVGRRHPDHPVILYIGALSRTKGLDQLVLAAREVKARVPAVEFLLCGEWSPAAYQAELCSLVQRENVQTVVRFPGPAAGEDKASLLEQAWALVVPSPSEGQPWVILEAMSAGVPVVATDTGAIAETVEHGQSGFVVPVNDHQALADRLGELLQDDPLWTRMSREALQRYQRLFTVKHSHAALATVLERVASDKTE